MALYPRTTTFYKAIIINLPPVATADYELIFEDTSYPEGYSPPMMVAQRYVIAYKQTKKITNVASWQPAPSNAIEIIKITGQIAWK